MTTELHPQRHQHWHQFGLAYCAIDIGHPRQLVQVAANRQ